MHVSHEVKKLQEKLCTLEASKDGEVINQVECHDLEATNSNTIQQLQQDIALLKVSCYLSFSMGIVSGDLMRKKGNSRTLLTKLCGSQMGP